jgi:hypothetical protein
MGISFDPADIFELRYQAELRQANHDNEQALLSWLSFAESWRDQVRNQWVPGTPLPAITHQPAEVIRVTVDYGARTITTKLGPDLVADGKLEPPPPPPPKPPNVAELGAQVGYKMFACGPNDTMPYNREGEPATVTTFNGKQYVKIGVASPWVKDGVTVYYKEL